MVPAGGVFRRTALSYSVGHVFNDLSAACWYTYLLVFLTKVCLPSSARLVCTAFEYREEYGSRPQSAAVGRRVQYSTVQCAVEGLCVSLPL
jgi:hypothetical protein